MLEDQEESEELRREETVTAEQLENMVSLKEKILGLKIQNQSSEVEEQLLDQNRSALSQSFKKSFTLKKSMSIRRQSVRGFARPTLDIQKAGTDFKDGIKSSVLRKKFGLKMT